MSRIWPENISYSQCVQVQRTTDQLMIDHVDVFRLLISHFEIEMYCSLKICTHIHPKAAPYASCYTLNYGCIIKHCDCCQEIWLNNSTSWKGVKFISAPSPCFTVLEFYVQARGTFNVSELSRWYVYFRSTLGQLNVIKYFLSLHFCKNIVSGKFFHFYPQAKGINTYSRNFYLPPPVSGGR